MANRSNDPSSPTEANPWTTLSTAIRYEDFRIQLLEHQVLDPKGKPTFYRVVHYKLRAVTVLPIDAEGYTYLVGQYRYPLSRYSWELPGGGGLWDDPPEESARRELSEETGLTAHHLREVLKLDVSNGITDEQAWCFLAWGLAQGEANPDDSEVLKLRRLPFREAVEMVHTGALTEAVSAATILRVDRMVQTGEAPAEVLAVLKPRAKR